MASQNPNAASHFGYMSDTHTPYGATILYAPAEATSTEYNLPKRTLSRDEIKPASCEQPQRNVFAPYFCEFMGTFLLAFTVACCPKTVWTPTAIAGVVVALVYAFFPVSGACLNPAVTLTLLLCGKMKFLVFAGYVVAQVAGAMLAIAIVRLLFLGDSSMDMFVAPVPPFSFGVAAAVDMIYTTMLAFVSLNVTGSSTMNKNSFYGLAIGFVIVAASYASRDISISFFNPALTLAFGWYGIHWCFLFALFELGGGIVAALLYRMCRYNEYSETHMLYEIEAGDRQTLYDVTTLAPPSLKARMLSEFLGTCGLLLTYGLNTILNTGAIAWPAAAALLSMMYALATVSGGHFNPAVTFGVVLSGRDKCSVRDGCFYALAQLLAAIVVGIFVSYVSSQGPTPKSHHGLFIVDSSYGWYQISIVEFLFTFVLVYVVLTVATSETHTNSWPSFYFALAIGFTMVGASYAAGDISGGYLNPAVALGFAVEGQPNFTSDATVKSWPTYLDTLMRILAISFKFIDYYLECLYYWIPELLGAWAAAGIFRIMYSTEYRQKILY